MNKTRLTKLAVLTAVMTAMLLTLAACGGASNYKSDNAVTSDMNGDPGFTGGYDYESFEAYGDTSAGLDAMAESPETPPVGEDVARGRKLVRTARLSCETKEYDAFTAWLREQVGACGGYVENMSEDQTSSRVTPYYYDYSYGNTDAYYMTRYASFTVRVPDTRLDGFLESIGGNCNVTSRSSGADDVTLKYADIEGHLAALKAEKSRLMELLDMAADLEDVLAIESRLTDVRAQLESYGSAMRLLESQISYATVDLSVTEVVEFTDLESVPTTFLGQLWAAFKHGVVKFVAGLMSFAIWLAENLLTILFWAAIVFAVIKYSNKRRAGKHGDAKPWSSPRDDGVRLRFRNQSRPHGARDTYGADAPPPEPDGPGENKDEK